MILSIILHVYFVFGIFVSGYYAADDMSWRKGKVEITLGILTCIAWVMIAGAVFTISPLWQLFYKLWRKSYVYALLDIRKTEKEFLGEKESPASLEHLENMRSREKLSLENKEGYLNIRRRIIALLDHQIKLKQNNGKINNIST